MKMAVILAAGTGEKMFPYALTRPKAMLPVCNRPVIDYQVCALLRSGVTRIVVAAQDGARIRNHYRDEPRVSVIDVKISAGTADTLLQMRPHVGSGGFLALYGDTLPPEGAIEALQKALAPAVLVAPLMEPSQNHICCAVDGGRITKVLGHPRGGGCHGFLGFLFDESIFDLLACNSGIFTEVQVGMMPPPEAHLEMTLHDLMRDAQVTAVECDAQAAFDLDKPWHLLSANMWTAQVQCAKIQENTLAEGASVCETALVEGRVWLGKNSRIGHNVIVRGNLIVGDDTLIDSGAILMGDNVIGDRCILRDGCLIGQGSVVGDDCVIGHGAELDGMIMRRVYLYHYMEIYGVIGENTDIGAATVCGTLRFDDGETTHRVLGRREVPSDHSCASYIGDYCRTGVNVTLSPGTKIGAYSVIGAGTILSGDVPDHTLLYPKQEHIVKKWGPNRYGW